MIYALIPAFPLLGFLLNGLLGIRYFPRKAVGAVAVGSVGASFLASAASFVRLLPGGEAASVRTLFTWIPDGLIRLAGGRPGAFSVAFAFRYDSLAAVMTLVVTGVGLLIHIYSIGYMAHDRSYARFFAYLNLFTFAMLVLVLGANLAVMFIGWEGVGLCSYLLIGFWFSKDSAARAGKKAFIMNRIGDFGFLMGIGLLISVLGTVDIGRIAAAVEGGGLGRGAATAAALLLFLGATGKSAQIPLYTWLPDAMEGPTPVSALIHAATMVTAGVYMVARLHVLYSFSPAAMSVVALTGAVTAFYAATMAVVQNDIKRVLAYSTISQIGYMFIGLGVGAYAAGIFHLVTHAFFKSLLFLAAGSVIHALSGEQDMRRMGGLRTRLPRTFGVFLVGALAISGIPGLSGFFSKDEILSQAFASGHYVAWALGLAGAVLTAFYIFRLIFLTFFGRPRFVPEAGHRVHEAPWIMTGPLIVLAAFSAAAGGLSLPHILGGSDWLAGFLEASTGAAEARLAGPTGLLLMTLTAALVVASLSAAYIVYVTKEGAPARRTAERFKAFYGLVSNSYYVDRFYERAIVGGTMLLAGVADWLDSRVVDGLVNGTARAVRALAAGSIAFDGTVIDGAVNGIGSAHRFLARRLARLQTGFVYSYALSIVIGLIVLVALVAAVF